MDKSQAAEQFRRVVQLFAAQLPASLAREVATVYQPYQVGKRYEAGDYFTSGTDTNGDPLLYSVVQGHTSSEEWPPELTPSLYTTISLDSSGWPVWAPPTGAHDAYNKGNVVFHEPTEKLWVSNRDGNTSEPGTDEWWSIYEEV